MGLTLFYTCDTLLIMNGGAIVKYLARKAGKISEQAQTVHAVISFLTNRQNHVHSMVNISGVTFRYETLCIGVIQ